MKKNVSVMKRILAAVLALMMGLMLTACGGGSALAESASGTHGSLVWEYDAESRTLSVGGSGAMEDFDSPEQIAWSAVLTSAQKVEVEEGVSAIGSFAFYYMPALTEVSLPATLTEIGDYAFAYCAALTDLTLPTELTAVGKGAFEACASLPAVYLSASVTEVGERAFAYCSALESAVITGALAELGDETFKNCTSLKTLMFHTSMTADKISETAFSGASMSFSDATLTESADGSSDVTIRYLYEDDSEAAPTVTETVPYGEEYKIASPVLNGYTASEARITGTADGTAHSHTVTYKVTEEQTEQAGEAETEEPAEEEKEPVTATTILAIVVMVLVLIGIAVGAFLLIRSDKKKNPKKGNPDKKDKK
ncbi:MAG: DUF4366 domain-containing protein [Ruminococcaceae bacterium]|nr:DUF4366 domain-containing protein [Oscillospiraceae bacterium]